MNIANYINIHTNIYTYITCEEKDSINSVLQHGYVVDNNCCCNICYFTISIFDPVSQRVQMEGSYQVLIYKD